MCNPSASTDNSVADQIAAEAKAARDAEVKRQGEITKGTKSINDNFAQFNDAFYTGRKADYLGYYQPQLDDQFGDATKNLTFNLARNGTLKSTMAADETAKLTKKYDLQKGSLVSNAEADGAALKSGIGQQKTSLISQLNATGDATAASDAALGRTQELFNTRPAFNPLGDLFAGAGDAVTNYAANANNQTLYSKYFGSVGTGSNTGSSKVVL